MQVRRRRGTMDEQNTRRLFRWRRRRRWRQKGKKLAILTRCPVTATMIRPSRTFLPRCWSVWLLSPHDDAPRPNPRLRTTSASSKSNRNSSRLSAAKGSLAGGRRWRPPPSGIVCPDASALDGADGEENPSRRRRQKGEVAGLQRKSAGGRAHVGWRTGRGLVQLCGGDGGHGRRFDALLLCSHPINLAHQILPAAPLAGWPSSLPRFFSTAIVLEIFPHLPCVCLTLLPGPRTNNSGSQS